jgi:hypothetical protein
MADTVNGESRAIGAFSNAARFRQESGTTGAAAVSVLGGGEVTERADQDCKEIAQAANP